MNRLVLIVVDGSEDTRAIVSAAVGLFPPSTRFSVLVQLTPLCRSFRGWRRAIMESHGLSLSALEAEGLERTARAVKDVAARNGIEPGCVHVFVDNLLERIASICVGASVVVVLGQRVRDDAPPPAWMLTLLAQCPCDLITIRV